MRGVGGNRAELAARREQRHHADQQVSAVHVCRREAGQKCLAGIFRWLAHGKVQLNRSGEWAISILQCTWLSLNLADISGANHPHNHFIAGSNLDFVYEDRLLQRRGFKGE